MKNAIKIFTSVLTVASMTVLSMISIAQTQLNREYTAHSLDKIETGCSMPVKYTLSGTNDVNLAEATLNHSSLQTVDFKLFGIFPVMTSNVKLTERKFVGVLGNPFGIKLYTDGVLLVKTSDFKCNGRDVSPAAEAGLKAGDYIVSINGQKVYSDGDINKAIKRKDNCLIIGYCRNDKDEKTVLYPKLCDDDGCYHLGMWLRDSSAGVGTLTFYDYENGVVAGLGHGLCDTDTGKRLSVSNGSIVSAKVLSVKKSKSGLTGELRGMFINKEYSNVLLNSERGIYAVSENKYSVYSDVEVALKSEVKTGKAEVLVTVDGTTPKLYNCEIKEIKNNSSPTRNFVIEITDKELIKVTGGICCGMSGSPILQNGKLVGAVTHVFLDTPTTGYAIFAENMLETAQTLANKGEIKDAS